MKRHKKQNLFTVHMVYKIMDVYKHRCNHRNFGKNMKKQSWIKEHIAVMIIVLIIIGFMGFYGIYSHYIYSKNPEKYEYVFEPTEKFLSGKTIPTKYNNSKEYCQNHPKKYIPKDYCKPRLKTQSELLFEEEKMDCKQLLKEIAKCDNPDLQGNLLKPRYFCDDSYKQVWRQKGCKI